MSRQKALVILFSVMFVASLAPAAGAAAKPAGPASTTITIRSYPGGMVGYVISPAAKTCAAGRKVEVFEQAGEDRDPAADHRIASARAAGVGNGVYQWSVDAPASGRFYARAAARRGCKEGLSEVSPAENFAAIADANDSSYPPCSPYVDEGTSETCDLGLLYLEMREESFLSFCSFGDSSGNCPGNTAGIFPWGTTSRGEAHPGARLYWTPRGDGSRNVSVVTFGDLETSGEGAAFVSGTMSWAGSDSFQVTDAWAQNELGGNYGDHFKTLSLPGRAPGEVGGPLKIACTYDSQVDRLKCWINGYLQLKG